MSYHPNRNQNRAPDLTPQIVGGISGLSFSSVDKLKQGKTVSPTTPTLTAEMIIKADVSASTLGYYEGWAAQSQPSGANNYALTTIQRARDAKGDQLWVPDGYRDFYVLDSTEFVAMSGDAANHVTQFGAIADYDEVSDAGTDNNEHFLSWLASDNKNLSFSGGGKYKVTEELFSLGPKIIEGYGSSLFQRDITKSLFNLNTMSGSEFHGGDYSHNMSIADYDIDNGRLFYANSYVTDITLYQARIYKTAQQGFDIDGGGNNIKVVLCEFEETARDGCFFVNVTKAKVSLSNFKNTGDDSIAFARQSLDHVCTNNTIDGAGSYNLGGSGIRSNSRGVISGNTIVNSDLFGIIAAANDSFPTETPNRLIISDNVITGINKTGTVTAGIGFKEVVSVECVSNQISMNSKEAHAHRIYGTREASGSVSIRGGSVENCKSIMYVRDSGVDSLSLSGGLKASDCDSPVLIEATGSVNNIAIEGISTDNVGSANLLHLSSANSANIGIIETSNNRISNPTGVNYKYEDNAFVTHISSNDQYPTGIHSDSSGVANAGVRVINGRFGDNCVDSGSISFNAASSGLVPMALSSGVVPEAHEMHLIKRTTLGSASEWFLDFIDGVNFRVNLDQAPGQEVTFDWYVRVYDNRVIK